MQNLFYNISQVLGITIIHSMWQGLIIYIGLRLFMLVLPGMASVVKYRVSYSALTAMLGWFVYTLFKELGHYNWLSTTALQITPLTLPAILHEVSAPANRLYFNIAAYMPYITMLYVVGLAFNTLRLTLAWNSIYRIRQHITDAGFDNTIKRLTAKLAMTKRVQVAFSEWVNVPCVTGFIKPIILLPVAITCYLNTDEIEAILLHELAHIKRNDYLLNFIQQVIGIVLFFNPFARLVTKVINEERENCCDDRVVHVTGSPFIYAQALLKLEENKNTQWQLALAATTKKYELLNRIERIMKAKTQTVNIRPVLIMVLALTCSISSIAWLNPEIKNGKVIIKNAPAIRAISAAISAPEPAPKPAAAPKPKKSISFKYVDDSTRMKLVNDTTIKNKKYKIVIEDDKGNKKEYNSISDLPEEDRNDFYKNTAGVNYQISQADSAQIMALKKYYTSDKWKKQTDELVKQSLKIAKQFNTPEFKKQQKAMVDQALAMAKKFNSPEWKKQQEDYAKMGEESSKKFLNSPEWKKQQEEYAKWGEEYAKKFNSPEWKKQQGEYVKMAMEYGKAFINSPEWKEQQEAIVNQALDIAKQFSSPEWKKEMNETYKFDEQDIEKKSKAFDKSYKPIKKSGKVMKIPVPEKPELPEKPEKPETPEKPDQSPL